MRAMTLQRENARAVLRCLPDPLQHAYNWLPVGSVMLCACGLHPSGSAGFLHLPTSGPPTCTKSCVAVNGWTRCLRPVVSPNSPMARPALPD